jgi:hypothetical protein
MAGAAGFWTPDCGSEIVNSEAQELLVFVLSDTVLGSSNQGAGVGVLYRPPQRRYWPLLQHPLSGRGEFYEVLAL